jgi:hypothetical protein
MLANANERSLKSDFELSDQERKKWLDIIDNLSVEKCPRTYLAVFGVLVVARSLESKDSLNVRDIKTGSSPKGYSAASIGSGLARFVKAHDIDLRAGSSQPMNNQPFTFEDFILDDMGVRSNAKLHWNNFLEAVNEIDHASSIEAQNLLVLLFNVRRKVQKPKVVAHAATLDISKINDYISTIENFVTINSDSGKIGQAFVSALLSLQYGTDNVLQGDSQDPDASLVGDVHVMNEAGVVLYSEVKQKVIGTGEIKGFIQAVEKSGGRKILYFALSNSSYAGHLDEKQIFKEVQKSNATFLLFTSVTDSVGHFLPLINLPLDEFAEVFSAAILERLEEAKVKNELIKTFKQDIAEFVTFTDDLS